MAGALVLWWLTLESGVHPAIAGVAVGLVCPVAAARPFERAVHPFSSMAIVPLFALANAGVTLDRDALSAAAGSAITLGVLLGLVAGQGSRGDRWPRWHGQRPGHGTFPEGMDAGHVGAAGHAGAGSASPCRCS